MRLLFVADLHYSLKQFDWVTNHARNYDLVAIGGDLLDLSSALDRDVQVVVMEKYLSRISQQTQLLVSSGNHDGTERSSADEAVARWLQASRSDRVRVDGESFERDGTLFTVCPWWDGPESRALLEAQLDADALRPRRRWVWIHHAPPQDSRTSWTGRKSIGDPHLVDWIGRHRPDLVLCGHIHNAPFYAEGSWIDRIGDTWVFNPGRQIGPVPAHIEFDLETLQARWISLEGEVVRSLSAPDSAAAGAGGC
jgi:Icc-related predicted phosphoesterase